MDLSKGICVLCTSNTKVVVPPQAEYITNLLCDVLDRYIDVEMFDETNTSLKVCASCLHDILQVTDCKQNVQDFRESVTCCSLCQENKHLISMADWNHFDALLENINVQKNTKCSFCIQCIKFLELLHRIKVNFLKKYPQLALTTAATMRPDRSTSKARRLSLDPLSNNKTKNNDLKSALKHLKPLKYSNFNIDRYKSDKKLLKQVAFVKLNISNQASKNQSKVVVPKRAANKPRLNDGHGDGELNDLNNSKPQPFFKIKLKLNAADKTQKVISGNITKSLKKSKRSSDKKELIVNIYKVDLERIRQKIIDSSGSDQEGSSPLTTPTKASRKLLPDDPLSSNKKQKNVTFAEDLNVEIVEGLTRLKNKRDGSPLKSLLKKGSSPTADLLKNGSVGILSDEDSECVGGNIGKDNFMDSDEEMHAAKSYVQDILENNDNIFESLKNDGGGGGGSNNKIGADINENKSVQGKSNKKRKWSSDSSNDSDHDDDDENNTKKKKRKMRRDSDDEDKIIENGHHESETSSPDKQPLEGMKRDEKPNEESKPLLLSSQLDPVSSIVSLDLNKEDSLMTLKEYKKVRRSVEASATNDDELTEKPLDNDDVSPPLIESDEGTSIINKEVTTDDDDDDDRRDIRAELKRAKVSSDNELDKDDDTSPKESVSSVPLPEVPECDTTASDILPDNPNTVSDQDMELNGEDREVREAEGVSEDPAEGIVEQNDCSVSEMSAVEGGADVSTGQVLLDCPQ